MSSIVAHRPRFSEEDAVRFAQELYHIDATAQTLPSERDQNFHLRDGDGEEYVLKIANAAEERDNLDFQNRVVAHLGGAHGKGVWPQAYPTHAGETIATVANAAGTSYMIRLLSYIPGVRLVDVKPHTPGLLRSLGAFMGKMDRALEAFPHEAAQRDLKWHMDNGPVVVRENTRFITDRERRGLVTYFRTQYETHAMPLLPALRRSVIHNDANDYNVLVDVNMPENNHAWEKKVVGVIDFGDMVRSYTVCDLAVALAYAMLGKSAPLDAAAHVVGGYHAAYPLSEPELEALFHLVYMRLCMSVAISAHQRQEEPDQSYLSVSEAPAWKLLERLRDTPPNLAYYIFRRACRLSPCPRTPKVADWLRKNTDAYAPVMGPDVDITRATVFDLSVGGLDLALLKDRTDIKAFTGLLFRRMRDQNATVGIGRYNEPRQVYTSELFALDHDEMPESRTVHLGMDLFLAAGAPVFAPIDGVVHSFRNNTAALDYGPTIILRHDVDDGALTFYTLYGHLSLESLDRLYEGMPVKKGDRIATLGDDTVNGGWPPHLHFQVITDMLGRTGEFPGVGAPGQREVWLSLAPDPNPVVGVPPDRFPKEARSAQDILRSRQAHIGKSLSISYDTPLKMVRGYMQYLYDEVGRAYLDAVNNVPHVGHSHPRVVEAGQRQMAVLNTNTRYLHDNLVDYAERLCATLPDPLSVCFFVNSGSEANDLALRLARSYTKQRDMVVLDGAYHGNLTSLIDISPYKFDGPGGAGSPPYVHKITMPDPYRGRYKGYEPQTGVSYARHVREVIAHAHQQDRNICAFIAESLLGCGGQIVLPETYLQNIYRYIHDTGGVCIADEVQVGFGRVGTHFWGFETQRVTPDILTLGKPIGNGHPLGAVITTPEIADAFANGMEYFNTFGGNPVSCAIGMAVLDVVQEENLQENALEVGNHMMGRLRSLMTDYPLIGDVRGLGLYIGVELVLNRETLAPAGPQASYIANRMKDHGILISTDGPLHNVLKIKPPLVFTKENADRLVHTLEKILEEDFVQVGKR